LEFLPNKKKTDW